MISISSIQIAVAKSFRVPVAKMSEPLNCGLGKDGRNAREFSDPRRIAMFLASDLTTHSLNRIGYYFGRRDHSTIIAGIRAAQKRIETDAALAAKVVAIKNSLTPRYPVENPPAALVNTCLLDA